MAGRRSLVGGLVAVFGVGYVYGIVRANLLETYSHFIFDASVLGLYAAQLFRKLNPSQEFKVSQLRPWLEVLIAWPVLLFFIPIQDMLIQFVGLRGCIFFLPFLLFGARLENKERYRLALWIAGLNLMALVVASTEFFWGVERFFPHNKLTELIYISRDVVGHSSYRIPSTFSNAHSYGGTMAVTLPLLIGALVQERKRDWHFYLLMLALAASIIGVLMSAARTHFIIVSIIIVVATFSLRTRFGYALGWIIMLCIIGWFISGENRLQRFTELSNTDMVIERVSYSVNMSFLEVAAEYPMGNGLGGGGTSIPYFLQDRIKRSTTLENEYARIMLEQGIIGLMIWVAFILWLLKQSNNRSDSWYIGWRLAWVACAALFVIGLTGTGLLTAIPQTALFLLLAGWVGSRRQLKDEHSLVAPMRLKVDTPMSAHQ